MRDRTISLPNVDDIETLKRFFNKDLVDYDYFSEVYEAIDAFKIIEKYGDYGRKKNVHINKIIGVTYPNIMKFKTTNKVKGVIFCSHFLDNVSCLIYNKNVIHHSHKIGDIIGCAHSFWNLKVMKNKNQTSAIAHNLFGFDFFFFFLFERFVPRILEDKKYHNWRYKSFRYKFCKPFQPGKIH